MRPVLHLAREIAVRAFASGLPTTRGTTHRGVAL
jgi:hypothetical protein